MAKKGNLREIRRFVARGGNLNYVDYDSRTALHVAVCAGQREVVRYLVMHGSKLTLKDRYGNTPYDDAKRCNDNEITEYLRKHLSI